MTVRGEVSYDNEYIEERVCNGYFNELEYPPPESIRDRRNSI